MTSAYQNAIGAEVPVKLTPAGAVPVTLSGESITVTVPAAVEITNDAGNPIPVSGPVTDAQLRATAVPVSGPMTDAQMRATAVPVTGPVTDAQMRASLLKVAPAVDSAGTAIAPDSWSHVYAYDGSGNLTTDTATDGTSTWIKTYGYTANVLTSETKWVKQ